MFVCAVKRRRSPELSPYFLVVRKKVLRDSAIIFFSHKIPARTIFVRKVLLGAPPLLSFEREIKLLLLSTWRV